MDSANIQRISKALANETRLLIFEAIASNKEMNCGAIVTLCGVTPATVSYHFGILSDAGLIESRRQGQFAQNRVVPETIENYVRELFRLTRALRRGNGVVRRRRHGARVGPLTGGDFCPTLIGENI